jgi:hypothetical protein
MKIPGPKTDDGKMLRLIIQIWIDETHAGASLAHQIGTDRAMAAILSLIETGHVVVVEIGDGCFTLAPTVAVAEGPSGAVH